ncbi:MAG: hypothetical protein U0984_04250 [Prosthecobacter sp.]|nr:hypothetical protein [Prosthecobacter sp.]
MPVTSTPTEEIARRVAWWKEPVETLAATDEFLCRVMMWGTWEDCVAMLAEYGRDAFRKALSDAPPGILDARSWAYWRGRLGLPSAPLPERRLP